MGEAGYGWCIMGAGSFGVVDAGVGRVRALGVEGEHLCADAFIYIIDAGVCRLILRLAMKFKMLFSKFYKKRALKKYINKLPALLIQRYGKSDHYTLGQINTTIEAYNLNTDYIHYAHAIFLNKETFKIKYENSMNYNELITEIMKIVPPKNYDSSKRYEGYPVQDDFSWIKYIGVSQSYRPSPFDGHSSDNSGGFNGSD